MSFVSDDDLGYLETVQLYFTEVTGRMALFSGRDLELLSEWRERGATAKAVCRGLREAVDRLPDDDPPRGVYACRKEIEPYVERAARRRVGEPDDASRGSKGRGDEETSGEESAESAAGPGGSGYADGLIERALDRVERAGRRCESEKLRDAYRRAWKQLRRIDGGDGDRLEELAAIEEGLVEAHYEALAEAERRAVDEQIGDGERAFLDEMSESARRTHRLAQIRQILAEEDVFVPLLE
ncbi:MAG: hypothetical protein ABEL76_05390 [Bradymonadaceae bacterium]